MAGGRKIVIAGPKKSGKSALARAFTYSRFIPGDEPTSAPGCLCIKDHDTVIYDLSGDKKYRNLNLQYYKGATAIILTCDVTDKEALTKLANEYVKEERIKELVAEGKVFIVVTKVDEKISPVSYMIDPEQIKQFAGNHNLRNLGGTSVKDNAIAARDIFFKVIHALNDLAKENASSPAKIFDGSRIELSVNKSEEATVAASELQVNAQPKNEFFISQIMNFCQRHKHVLIGVGVLFATLIGLAVLGVLAVFLWPAFVTGLSIAITVFTATPLITAQLSALCGLLIAGTIGGVGKLFAWLNAKDNKQAAAVKLVNQQASSDTAPKKRLRNSSVNIFNSMPIGDSTCEQDPDAFEPLTISQQNSVMDINISTFTRGASSLSSHHNSLYNKGGCHFLNKDNYEVEKENEAFSDSSSLSYDTKYSENTEFKNLGNGVRGRSNSLPSKYTSSI